MIFIFDSNIPLKKYILFSESQATEAPVKQMPFGYFRSFSYQPFLAYPPPQPMYSNYQNPFMQWPNQMYPSPNALAAHQAVYGTVRTKPSSNLESLIKSLKSVELDSRVGDTTTIRNTLPAAAQKLTSITTTTTTPKPTTQSTTTTTTTEPTTTTTSLPLTTTIQYRRKFNENHRLSSQQSAPIPAIVSNRRNDVPLISRKPTIDPLVIQRYLAEYLSQNQQNGKNVQFVPCMCPVSLGMQMSQPSFYQQMPDMMTSKSRSDDIGIESGDEPLENFDFDSSTTDQTFY